jgi:phosphatidylglycerol:prolipoprotein diacylglycerol transferase
MFPIIFHLPLLHIPIYGYGVMMVCAFLATQWLASRLATLRGLDGEIFVNIALISLVVGVIGARASSVLENLSYYTNPRLGVWDNFLNMINIRSGGLTYYGGVILAAPAVLGYILWKKVPPRLAIDICAPCLTLGLAIGRIGCFLNGCCYGANANVPWAVEFPYSAVGAYADQVDQGRITPPPELLVPTAGDHVRLATMEEINQGFAVSSTGAHYMLAPNARAVAAGQHSLPVHPAQLYSTITSLLITAIVLCYFFTPHSPGRCLALTFMLEGPSRFLLEMLRVEPPVLGQMSLSMVIGLGIFAVGVVLWFSLAPAKKPASPAVQPAM